MNNLVHRKLSSLLMPTGNSVPGALRWLRRVMTLILILANFAVIMWANLPR